MKAYSIPTLIIASICLTIAISDTLAWSLRNKRKSDLAFILLCLSGMAFCLFCSGEYDVDLPAQSVFWLRGQAASIVVAEFALFWFVAEMTRLIGRRGVALCLAWTLLAVLSQVIDLGDLSWIASRPQVLRVELPFGLDFVYKEVERGVVIYVLNFVGLFYLAYLSYVVVKFRRAGNRSESLVLFFALGFIVFAELIDFLVGIGAIDFLYTMEYGWLATILFVGLRRSNDFIEAALTRQELWKTDQELKESQATLSTIIDSSADMIWSVELQSFGLLTFNESFRDYFTRDRGIAVAAGMGPEELSPSDEEARRWRGIYEAAAGEDGYSIEMRTGARPRTFALSVNPLRRDGVAFGLAAFAQDITERKRAEERIRSSLSEKEILIKEVYHRTKNNMSIIISMLKLQANEIGDERLREAFAVTTGRILAMSQVHDKLYKTDDFTRVELKDYIGDLATELLAGYALSGDNLTLSLDMESAHVSIDTAINCGLILNELITNAVKYAFPDGRRGEIKIRLRKEGGGGIRLILSDDGVGLPPGFDVKRDGHLGLRLVTSLAAGKLRTEAVFARGNGLSCSLSFLGEEEG